jgi:hypothetical protein
MDAQINSRISIEYCKKKNATGQIFIPKNQGNEHRETKRIGCVTGNKSVKSAPVIQHSSHHILKIGVVSGSKSMKNGFEKSGRNPVATQNQ